MIEQEIQMADGIWTVLKRGDEICIVDFQGRCRHMSKGHVNTASHLAMLLAEQYLDSEPNADEALKMQVEKFRNGE